MSNLFHLLKTRRFLPLFVTQYLGAFNDNIFKNALVILITYSIATHTHSNAQILITVAAGLFILPFFIFSATAGQLADKYEKSMLIRYIKLIEVGLMILAAIGFYLENITILICALFLTGIHSSFFGPLKYSILPDHLREDELISGNGLIDAGTFLAILTGTILGGVLIITPLGEHLISIAIILIAIAGWLSSQFIPRANVAMPQLELKLNFIKETWDIVRYSAKNKEIFTAILGISWFWLIGATFLSQFPTFTKNIIGAKEQVVTLFLTIFSIGVAIGSLSCNKLLNSKISTAYVPVSVLAISLFTTDLYVASQHVALNQTGVLMSLGNFLSLFNSWRIILDLLFISISGGIYIVPLYVIVQYRSEASHRARTIASNNVVNSFFMVLAAIATIGMLSMQFTVAHVFLVVAILNLGMTIYLCKYLPGGSIRSYFLLKLKNRK